MISETKYRIKVKEISFFTYTYHPQVRVFKFLFIENWMNISKYTNQDKTIDLYQGNIDGYHQRIEALKRIEEYKESLRLSKSVSYINNC